LKILKQNISYGVFHFSIRFLTATGFILYKKQEHPIKKKMLDNAYRNLIHIGRGRKINPKAANCVERELTDGSPG